jgi:hypothetical protein
MTGAPATFSICAPQQIHHEAGTPDNAVKLPGPDHPITIERNPNRVVVSWQAAS